MALQAGTRLGSYEILAPLGAGGMGEVYRARDPKLNREVAVKVLPEHLSGDGSALERLEREARALASNSHPNILSIFDFGSANGVTYAVMELLDGETLRGLLTQGPLPVRKAVDYATQIAAGLGAAHERGIIHRDLKPDNLFVTRDGRIKILDFGLARQQVLLAADDATAVAGATEPGTVLGTVGYMSPEQVRGKVADARSDIFSFGAVLYEMLSGRRAFKGDSAAETLHAILRDDPPELSQSAKNVPPALDRIVAHCLEKSPDERFQSARDLAFNLKSLTTLSDANRSGAVGVLSIAQRRRLLRPTLLVVAGAVIGGVAAWILKPLPPVGSPRYQRLTFDRGTIGQARFAPDGQTIVYDAAWRGRPRQVFTTRVDSRESRLLEVGEGSVQALSSKSELAIALGSFPIFGETLALVPLAGGAPRPSVEHIAFSDWSPDGAELAVIRLVGNEQHVEYPVGTVIYRTTDSLTHLRVSPDGRRVAAAEHPAADPFSAGYLVTIDRSGHKAVLSTTWSDIWGVAWRPDGQEIWFTAGNSGEPKSLWAATLDGHQRLVSRELGQMDLQDIARDGRALITQVDFRSELMVRQPGAQAEQPLTWLGESVAIDLSPDGRRLLFSELLPGGGHAEFAYLRATDGSPAVRLAGGGALALSPDGNWALTLSTGVRHLVLVPTGAGDGRDLSRTGFDYSPYLPGYGPVRWGSWLPDGRHVIFNATRNGGPLGLFLQDIDGGEPRRVGPEGVPGLAIAPDGRSVVVIRANGTSQIASLDGGETFPIKGLEPGERPIRWTADGRFLLCRLDHDLGADISSVEIATGRRKLLWQLDAADPAGADRPTNIAITADGRAYAYSYFSNLSNLYLVDGLK